MIDKLYNLLFQRHTNDIAFWKKNWSSKIELYEKKGITDWDVFSSRRYYQILFNDISDYIGSDFNGKNVLEFGAGTGMLSLFMAAHGANVYLLDVLPEALQYASILEKTGRIELKGFKGTVTYLNSDFARFSNNKSFKSFFDIVHNSGVVEEYDIKGAVGIIDMMRKLAKDNGSIVIGVPNFLNPYLIRIWMKYGKGNELYFNKSRLRKVIRSCGFDKINISTTSYVYPFKKYTCLESFLGKNGLGFLHVAIVRKE